MNTTKTTSTKAEMQYKSSHFVSHIITTNLQQFAKRVARTINSDKDNNKYTYTCTEKDATKKQQHQQQPIKTRKQIRQMRLEKEIYTR